MKAKRFMTEELRVYRKSNSKVRRYFDTLDEAIIFAREQRLKHPRTKKLYDRVMDMQENKIYKI